MGALIAAQVAAASIRELHGGHQALVFEVTHHDGRRVVAKVLDASLVNSTEVAERVRFVAELAEIEPMVCRPIPVDGLLVTEIVVDDLEGLLTVYEHADGVAMDTSSPTDARRMGQLLARLHESMNRVRPANLPTVAALALTDPGTGDRQLLHGDFNAGNLRQLDGAVKIFDFDDCGYGPRSFDVANALYMVLFDSMVGQHADLYAPFAEALMSGYTHGGHQSLDAADVIELIHRRVESLASWLDDLPHAPTGIRTATPEWHAVLRSFVRDFRSRQV